MHACIRALRALFVPAALAFALTGCGGGGGGGSTPATTTGSTSGATSSTGSSSTPGSTTTPPASGNANQVPVTVEQNPAISSYITANMPYVTVTVCNGIGSCVTVPQVLVDTGSYGLRLFSSAIGGLSLTPMQSSAKSTKGEPIGECASFVSSALWGAVRMASVSIGSNTTTGQIPVQVVGDTTFAPSTTALAGGGTVCPNASPSAGAQQFGANGVLGVGLFAKDGQAYYACSGSTCTATTPPSQVLNPVAALPSDNNGVVLTLPAVSSVQNSVSGTLTFGVDTQTDNTLGGYTILPADSLGYITVTLNASSYPKSYIDSGSNANFLALPGSVPVDSSGFYAPPTPQTYTVGVSGGTASYSADVTVEKTSPQTIGVAVFPYLASPSSSTLTQDLGLPFFYGRSIAYAINGASTAHGIGPYYAVH